ncbi:MAG: hypothetical protein ACRDP6_00170 [Actinoallomurus sp.]
MADAEAQQGNPDDHSRVHQTAFNGAYEFIPEGATWAVIAHDGEPPKLVAVDGTKLYTMTVGDLGEESLSGTATCRVFTIDAARSTAECTSKFIGHRGPQPMSRETTWTFDLGGDTLAFSTKFSAGRVSVPQDEALARVLAGAVGWTGLPGAAQDYSLEAV